MGRCSAKRKRGRAALRGASAVEYLIVLGMMALTVVGAVRFLGSEVSRKVACQAMALVQLEASSQACGQGEQGKRVSFGGPATDETSEPAPVEPGVWDGLGSALGGALGPTSDGRKVCFGNVCLDGACFVAGTPVVTEDGPQPIEAIEPGTWVWSRDEATGDSGWRRVVRTKVTPDRETLSLSLEDDQGEAETLGVTPEHPFWSHDRGWVAAGMLELDEEVATADGRSLRVAAIAQRDALEVVFNLEVEGFHTYFVGALGAWVHNDCPPEEQPLRRMLGMGQYSPYGAAPAYELRGVRDGKHRWHKLPEPPKGTPSDKKAELDALRKEIDDAEAKLKTAADAYSKYQEPKVREAMRKAPFGSGGFSVPLDDEAKRLGDIESKAAGEVRDAIVRYLASTDALRGGADIRYDQGKVVGIVYPGGTSVDLTHGPAGITQVTYTDPDGTRLRVYKSPDPSVWKLDTGKGKDDPIALRGSYEVTVDGIVVRTDGNRRIATFPDGQSRVTWTKPDAWEMKPELPGRLTVRVTRAEDGIALSVHSGDAGIRSTVLRLPYDPDRVANPKIIKKEGDTILVSLDGSDTPHVAVTATEKPWGEGLAYRDRRVPYYDEKNLRVVMRDLPDGTKSLDVHIATATKEARHSWVTPLPGDENYLLPPRWVTAQSGTWRGSGEPRMGWKRKNQFVADTTSSDRKWAEFVDTYVTNMARGWPGAGTILMAGEAISGTELTGRSMAPKERVVHGAFAALGALLELGPVALEAAQTARAVSQIQKASGVTRPEAKALLDETRLLAPEERALLKAASEGKPVDAGKLAPVVNRLEKAMARARPAAAADPAAAVARAEASMARPATAGGAAAKEAVTTRFGKSNPDLEKALHGLIDDTAHRLNVVESLKDPATRGRTLDLLDEMFQGRALGAGSLDDFSKANPGKGPVFEPVAREVNFNAAGQTRKAAHVEAMKNEVPAMRAGANPSATEMTGVRDYARYLKETVEPGVSDELASIVRELNQELGGGASFSVRTKSAEGLVDKVQRMTTGTAGRGVRPDYQVGDVIDGVGGRITVDNMEQLGKALEKVNARYGTGEGGRILEIENMYASPKASSPRYRVIPMIIRSKDGKATFELQLTTRRASIAADLDHNINYKPLVPATDAQKALVQRLQAEASALDQLEALGRPLPKVPEVPGRAVIPGNPGAIGPALVPKQGDPKRDPPPAPLRKP